MELITGSYKALEKEFLSYFSKIKNDPLEKVLIITQSARLSQSLKEKLLTSRECVSCVFWQDILGLVSNINQAKANYVPLKQKTALDYFKLKNFLQQHNLNTSAGYIQALQAAFRDMQNALIMPQDLLKIEEYNSDLAGKELKELIFIYQNYLALNNSKDELSYKDFFTCALDNVENNSYLAQFKQIIFYGIYDFTSLQYDIVKAVGQNYPCAIFYPYEDLPAYKYVKDFYLANIVGLGTEHITAQLPKSEIETLCTHLFEGPEIKEKKYPANVKIIDTADALDQVKSAAKEVLSLHKKGFAFKDMAVCARSLEPYKDYIAQVFEQNAIPVNVNFEETFISRPLVSFCLNILNIARNNFNKGDVLSFINSPYLKNRFEYWNQTIKDIGVQTGLDQWNDLLEQAIKEENKSAATLKDFLVKLNQKVSSLEEAASFGVLAERVKDIFNTFLDLEKLNAEEQKYFECLNSSLKNLQQQRTRAIA